MGKVSDKNRREDQNAHFMCNNVFVFFDYHPVYEMMWKNITERGRAQMKVWRMSTACWIPKSTNTHSEYVILIQFSTVTMVARTRLSVTLRVTHLPG
jgi:hypothetical protein